MSSCKRLIQIGDKIVDSRILRSYFACDIAACGGACCREGSSGAPLEVSEIEALEAELPQISAMLPAEAQQALQGGAAYRDGDGDWVTQLVDGAQCAFAVHDDTGYRCAIELQQRQGLCRVRKPISCHLYPIRVGRSGAFTLLRYDVWDICAPARALGERLGMKVYQFLREPLVLAFGEAFYHDLGRADEMLDAPAK